MKTIERIISVIEILDTEGWTIMFNKNVITVQNIYHTFKFFDSFNLPIRENFWYHLDIRITGESSIACDDHTIYITQ